MGVPFVSWHQPKTNARTRGGWFATAELVRRLALPSYAEALTAPIRALLQDSSLRAALAARGKELVDGAGVERVLMHSKVVGFASDVRRKETVARSGAGQTTRDARALLFNRAYPWEKHTTWYAALMADESRRLLIAMDEDDNSVGQLRLDRKGSTALLSFSISPRSGGVASPRPCSRWAPRTRLETSQLSAVNAYVKPDNVRSRRAFEKAGYRYRGEEVLGRTGPMHYFVGREEVAR